MKITYSFIRETPGTRVYGEVDKKGNAIDKKAAVIGTIYVRKDSEIGKKNADTLEINIEAK